MPKNNKTNNNNKKIIKVIKTKQRKRNRKKLKIYKYKIRTSIINYISPTYTERNLKFDIYDLLTQTEVFLKLKTMYNQYKLNKVTFAATPRTVNGSDPAPVWIFLDTDGYIDPFNYANLQELQGSKSLPVKHFSLTSYSTSGKQRDFHYWRDMTENVEGIAIRLRSEALPTEVKFWSFQLEFDISVRGMYLAVEDQNQAKVIQESDQKVQLKDNKTVTKVQDNQQLIDDELGDWYDNEEDDQ